MDTTWAVLGWLVQLAATVGGVAWLRRAARRDAVLIEALRRDVRAELGLASQAIGAATATFDKQAVALIREVRSASEMRLDAVPAAPCSRVQAVEDANEDERRTVEMDVWGGEDEREATVTPIGDATREKLASLSARMNGGAK